MAKNPASSPMVCSTLRQTRCPRLPGATHSPRPALPRLPKSPAGPASPPAGVPKGGRNNWLFDALRSWAYQEDKGEDEAGWCARVLDKALEMADSLQDLDDDPHVASTAKSVARFCWENPSFGRKGHNYDHSPERQRKRAYIGIKKKRAALLERNMLISRLHFKQSWPQGLIAKHLGISARQVRRVVARWKEIEGTAAKLKELSRQTGNQGGQDTRPIGHEPISAPLPGGLSVSRSLSVATGLLVGGPGGRKSPQANETGGSGLETQAKLPGLEEARDGGGAVEFGLHRGAGRRRSGNQRGQGPPVDERLEGMQLRTPYEVIAASLYLSINQVQRLVKAARMVGLFMPTRTRYENRKHSGWVQIAAWV